MFWIMGKSYLIVNFQYFFFQMKTLRVNAFIHLSQTDKVDMKYVPVVC